MNDRLVTVATFDLAYKADLAKAALDEVGIVAEVNDREIVSMDWLLLNAVGGVKLQVAESDAERAFVVIEPFTRPGKFEQPVSDEELERQALDAPTEDEVRAAEVAQAARERGIDLNASVDVSGRDRLASQALWWMVGGVFCMPAWIVGMYFLLSAAFRSGPLSANGRINLRVAGVIGLVMTLLVILFLSRAGNHLNQ